MSSRSAAIAAINSVRVFQMGSTYLHGNDLASIARPHLERCVTDGRDRVSSDLHQGEIGSCASRRQATGSVHGAPMVREPAYAQRPARSCSRMLGEEFDKYVNEVTLSRSRRRRSAARQRCARRSQGAREGLRSTSRSSCQTCVRRNPSDGPRGAPMAAMSIAMPDAFQAHAVRAGAK